MANRSLLFSLTILALIAFTPTSFGLNSEIYTDLNSTSCSQLVIAIHEEELATMLAPEICNNGIDDDGDGLIDCADPDCTYLLSSSGDVPVSIASNSPNTVSSTIVVSNSGAITDINMTGLDISHTYIDDLVIKLIGPDGTSATVMNRPCNSQNNINISFDDEASSSSYPCPPTNGLAYQPYELLSVFDGKEMNGTWTLQVEDVASQDGGSINAWQLEFSYSCAVEICNNGIDDDGDGLADCADPDCSYYSSSSSDVPVTITSSSPVTVTSTLTISNTGTITDVNIIGLDISHTYIDDLIVRLKGPDGTTVTVLDRPCGSQNNINMSLDDEASSSSYPCPPTDGLAYIPENTLSFFDGKEMNGTWTLEVEDAAAQDGGSINAWQLEFTISCVSSIEICNNGIDDDGDGLVDLDDPDCCGNLSSISKNNWSLQYVDSEELVGENGVATNAFDGDVNTIWHSEWYYTDTPLPHEIQIDLGGSTDIGGFKYLPRQYGINGRIGNYEFYVSTDGVSWGSPIVAGTWTYSGYGEKEVQFATVSGRYIRLRATSEAYGNPWTSAAEIDVLTCQNVEICANGIDDDGDGFIDNADTDCSGVYKQLYLSDPSQALDRVDPVATADATTSQTVALSSASAFSVDLNPVADNDLWAGAVAANYGTCNTLYLDGNFVDRSLLKFDLSGIPSNATITTATLSLSKIGGSNTAANVDVHRITADWDEGASTCSGAAGVSNYNVRKSGINWATAGGDYDATVEASTSVGGNASYSWSLENLVQDWIDGSNSNYGLLLKYTTEGTSNQKTFGSRENSNATDRPVLSISYSVPATGNVMFTQNPALCSPLTIKSGQSITLTNYVSIVSGSMPTMPDITAVVKYDATTIITLTNPTYNSINGTLTWAGTLGSDVTVPAGEAIVLEVTVAQTGVSFTIDYDSQTSPSFLNLPVSTFIDITSHAVYNAPYPGGSLITGTAGETVVYLRTVVTDPFGFDDITGLDITITPPGTTVASTPVATSGCTKTHEYVWNMPNQSGTFSLPATAKEGYENTVTDVKQLSFDLCLPAIGTPVFALGASSTRCQGAGSVTYSATSTNSTGLSYSIDSTSIIAGNSINASNGSLTYVAGWNGTTVVTARATGCGGPKTATHTVTVGSIPTADAGSDVSICGGSSTTLNASASGGASPYSYVWSHSLGSGASKTVSPSSNTTYSVTATDFNGCSATSQVTVTIIGCVEICDNGIDDDMDGLVDCADDYCTASGAGTISGDESICGPYTPTGISSVSSGTSGGGSSVQYRWQQTTDTLAGPWSNLGATDTALSYQPLQISQSTFYRRKASTVLCSDSLFSNIVAKAIDQNVTNAGSIGYNESFAGGYDPALISNVSVPSGGSGTIEYQWYVTTGGTWSLIPGATASTYDPPFINQSTWYRRATRTSGCTGDPNCCGSTWLFSNIVFKEVLVPLTDGGVIGLMSNPPGSGEDIVIKELSLAEGLMAERAICQWEYSDDNINWTELYGAIAPDLPANRHESHFYFRRKIKNADYLPWVYSNVIEGSSLSPFGNMENSANGDSRTDENAPESGCFISAFILLEGAKGEGELMRDDLRAKGLLPSASPYNHGDFEYGRVSGSIFQKTGDKAIVDWLNLELYSSLEDAKPIYSRPAFLLRDGSICSLDGQSPVSFGGLDGQKFHLVIRHRNHEPVASKKIRFKDGGSISVTEFYALEEGATAERKHTMPSMIHLPAYSNIPGNGMKKGYVFFDFNMDGAAIPAGPGNEHGQFLKFFR